MSIPRLLRPLRSSIAGPSRVRIPTTTATLLRPSSMASSPRPLLLPYRTFSSVQPQRAHTAQSKLSHREEKDERYNEGNDQEDGSPPPKSAYARFKLLTKKYGWYALGMYTLLSTIDFSLTFLMVHALGVERIEPLWTKLLYKYRVIRHGEEEAIKLQNETVKERAEDKKKEEEERAKGVKKGYWGSRTFWAEAVLAYGIHKTALLPFRAGLTVAWTPKVVNWLASRGWIGKVSTIQCESMGQCLSALTRPIMPIGIDWTDMEQ